MTLLHPRTVSEALANREVAIKVMVSVLMAPKHHTIMNAAESDVCDLFTI